LIIKLSCRDYGYECDFVVEGSDWPIMIEKFGKHTEAEHGIEYSKEVLMQFILRKSGG
jgi:predicted small metal-binding protein